MPFVKPWLIGENIKTDEDVKQISKNGTHCRPILVTI